MAVAFATPTPAGTRTLAASLDMASPPEAAFGLLTSVEKWPVWLSFVRSAHLVSSAPLGLGSEILLRSALPGESEQLYEVDAFIPNFHLSLVGAYSIRRRLDFRIEQKTSRSKLHVAVAYPAYHGRMGYLLDGVVNGRKLASSLDHALEHFRGLIEVRAESDHLLDDL